MRSTRVVAAAAATATVVGIASTAWLVRDKPQEADRLASVVKVRVPNVQPGDDWGRALRLLRRAGPKVEAQVVTAKPMGSFEQPYMVVGLEPEAGTIVDSGQTISMRLVGVTDLQELGLRLPSGRL